MVPSPTFDVHFRCAHLTRGAGHLDIFLRASTPCSVPLPWEDYPRFSCVKVDSGCWACLLSRFFRGALHTGAGPCGSRPQGHSPNQVHHRDSSGANACLVKSHVETTTTTTTTRARAVKADHTSGVASRAFVSSGCHVEWCSRHGCCREAATASAALVVATRAAVDCCSSRRFRPSPQCWSLCCGRSADEARGQAGGEARVVRCLWGIEASSCKVAAR